MPFGKIEGAIEKLCHVLLVSLIPVEIFGAETLVQLQQEIIRVQAMTLVGDERDCFLAGARQIQNRQAGAIL
jgi:hypothetical protein